jgi:hypothetical protein
MRPIRRRCVCVIEVVDSALGNFTVFGSPAGEKPMKRVFLIVCVLAYALSSSAPVAASKDEARREAAALLTKAAETTNIKAPGSPAFHLRIHVRASGRGGLEVEGTYLLDWVAPDRFHEEIAFPGYTQTSVAAGDKLWRWRSDPVLPFRVWQLYALIDVSGTAKLGSKEKVRKVRQSEKNGVRMTCIEFSNPSTKEICLEPANGLPHRISYEQVRLNPEMGSSAQLSYLDRQGGMEYAAYAPLGAKMFPLDLRLFEATKLVVEAHVESLAEAPNLAADLFAPPAKVEPQNWCPDPEPPVLVEGPSGLLRPGAGYGVRGYGSVAIYGVVGTDGRLHNASIVKPLSKQVDAEVLKAFQRVLYRPANCKGVSIEQEMVMVVLFIGP